MSLIGLARLWQGMSRIGGKVFADAEHEKTATLRRLRKRNARRMRLASLDASIKAERRRHK